MIEPAHTCCPCAERLRVARRLDRLALQMPPPGEYRETPGCVVSRGVRPPLAFAPPSGQHCEKCLLEERLLCQPAEPDDCDCCLCAARVE